MVAAKVSLPISRQLSAGAILYFVKEGKLRVVLLTQDSDFYNKQGKDVDIGPSGGVREGEDPLAAARREIKEETELTPEIDTSFSEDLTYEFNAVARDGPYRGEKAHIIKIRRYYIAAISENDLKKIRLSVEHLRWDAPTMEDALKLPELKDGQKELLRKVLARLSTPA